MRWLACSLLFFSLSASAQSVLLVPQDAKARPFAEELVDLFTASGVKVKMAGPTSPAVLCLKDKAKRNACLGDLEKKAKVEGVVVLSAVVKGPRANLNFELLVAGASAHKQNAKGQKGKLKGALQNEVLALIKAMEDAASKLPAEPEKPVVAEKPVEKPVEQPVEKPKDAPVEQPVLTPKKSVIEEELGIKMPTPRKVVRRRGVNVPAWVALSLGVVAAGTAAAMTAVAVGGNAQLQNTPGGESQLSYNEAVALRDATNTQFTVALVAGIGAAAAGGTAGLLWGLE